MADRAASVLARLKNKAAQSGRTYQLCLQLFCQEEFLRRLQCSRYAENMVLKGGLFLYSLTQFESRATVDVDFLLRNLPNTPEKLLPVLQEIVQSDTGNDFITFEVTRVGEISAAKKYAGITATIVAHIKHTRTVFGVDFGVGDVIIPRQEKRTIPTQLEDFAAPLVNTYSVETTVAEKLDAILYLKAFSSRMKDYYDIYYLAHRFDFDGSVLCEALQKTFANRERHYTTADFTQVIALANDADMQKKWTSFLKKLQVPAVEFADVLGMLDIFLRGIFLVAVEEDALKGEWIAGKGIWNN